MSDRLKRKRNAIILKDKVALDDWIKKTLPYKYPKEVINAWKIDLECLMNTNVKL